MATQCRLPRRLAVKTVPSNAADESNGVIAGR
jgi:hypothetical protein